MRIISPSDNWNIATTSNSKVLDWKVYARKTTTVNEPLTSGTAFTDVSEFVREIPNFNQSIELEIGKFSLDSFSLTVNNLTHWLCHWFNVETSDTEVEVKVVLNIGINSSNLSTDNCIVASGFVDKLSIEQNDPDDSISFKVYSYDEYIDRIVARKITKQNFRILNGNTTLVLNKLPGIYIIEASKSLEVQTIEFTYTLDTNKHEVKYNDGENVSITNNGELILYDSKNKLCRIYVLREELVKNNYSQDFIYKSAADSLPSTFYEDILVNDLIDLIVDEIPSVNNSITYPLIPTPYDSNERLNSLENITDIVGHSAHKVINFDSSETMWVGVGNKLYKKESNGTYTLKVTCTTDSVIRRIYTDLFSSNLIIFIFQFGGAMGVGKYNTSTSTYSSAMSMYLGGADITEKNAHLSFTIDTTNQVIYYLAASTNIRKIVLSTMEESEVYDTSEYYGNDMLQYNKCAFYSSSLGMYFFQVSINDIIYWGRWKISTGGYQVYNTSGYASILPVLGIRDLAVIESTGQIHIYYQSADDYKLNRYTLNYNVGTGIMYSGTNTVLDSKLNVYGLHVSGSNIYFYGNGTKDDNGTTFSFGYYTTLTNTLVSLNNFKITLPEEDLFLRSGSLYYISNSIYCITSLGRLFQFTNSNQVRINGTLNTSNMSIRELLNKICNIYNLIYMMRPNKSFIIFPRSSLAGQIQYNTNGGEQLNVTVDEVVNISSSTPDFGRATKVRFKSGDYSGDYNGTDYDTFDADNEKIIEIDSGWLQHSGGLTLRDYTKAYYPFFSKILTLLKLDLGIVPKFQYEVTDAVYVDLTGTQIDEGAIMTEAGEELGLENEDILGVENATGILNKQSINNDGSMQIEVLI